MKIEVKKSWLSALILLALAAAAIVYLAGQFLSMREVEPIYPGPGVTEIKMLSDWYPGLEGTAGDTEVYVLEGEQEGDSMLVLGGTHPNEPSGLVAAVLLIENAQPEAGTLYVIPRTNNSAFTCTDPQEGAPMRFTIDTPNGERWFRFRLPGPPTPSTSGPTRRSMSTPPPDSGCPAPRPGISTAPTRGVPMALSPRK